MKQTHLLLVHGAGIKPPADDYQSLWVQALRAGLVRESNKAARLFDEIKVSFVYYGDLTNQLDAYQSSNQPAVDAELDLVDRRRAIEQLAALTKTKDFRRVHYDALPGQSPMAEFVADIGAPLSQALGLGQVVKGRVVPELGAYWGANQAYAEQLAQRLADPLQQALAAGDRLMLVSHCLGSVVAYDTLCKISHQQPSSAKCELWVTLGSPLADNTVRSKLFGSSHQNYPNNLLRWVNIAAEDDYFCHDETVANDFKAMLQQRMISSITDQQIYNLAVRYGKSEPHHSSGYLIHPRMSRLLKDFLLDS